MRWRRRSDDDFGEEVRSHIALETDRLVSEGMDPRDARAAAVRRFGNVNAARERFYESRRVVWLDVWLRDLRYAARSLVKNRAFALITILTLALGVGLSTSVASIVEAVLLRPLPYSEPERLVFLWNSDSQLANRVQHGILTSEHTAELGTRADFLTEVAFLKLWSHNLDVQMDVQSGGRAERLRGSLVTKNFFDLLGVSAALGRTFAADDEADVAVLSHEFWRRRYGGDPAIVGQTIDLMAGRPRTTSPHTIVGVLPERFHFTYPEGTEVWAPLADPISPTRALEYVAVGRLQPGVSPDEAEIRATEIFRDIVRGYPPPTGAPADFTWDPTIERTTAFVESLHSHMNHDVGAGVRLLAVAAGLVFVIACVNVALLVLSQTVRRASEISIRTALGGTTWRTTRPLLGEILLMAAAGSATGVLAAMFFEPVVRGVIPEVMPRAGEISIDLRVLIFASAVGLAAAVLCGLTCVRYATRRELTAIIGRCTSRTTGDSGVARFRRTIIVFQVAVVVLCLTGSGLLLHSFWRLRKVDPGFDGEGVIAMEMRLLHPKYHEPGRMAQFQQEVLATARAVPGVQSVSMTSAIPMRGTDFYSSLGAYRRSVDPGYFNLMRIPLRSGRLFSEADSAGEPPVLIVSESFGRAQFGAASPIGQVLNVDGPMEIVGVVGDVRTEALSLAASPAFYQPRAQWPVELAVLVLRPAPGVADVARNVEAAIQRIDPEQPIQAVTTLDRIIVQHTANQRFYTAATVAFGLTALWLSMAGLAGIVSRTVSERRRDIAVRVAFGANRAQVLRLVVGSSMKAVFLGLLLGLAVAIPATRLFGHLLFEVTPLDPWSYAGAAAGVFLFSLLACYIPARRAAAVDPMRVLMTE